MRASPPDGANRPPDEANRPRVGTEPIDAPVTGDTVRDVDGADADDPELPILIFDGDCGFCTTSARWGQRRLGLQTVMPWQVLALDRYGVTQPECERAVQWVDRDAQVHSGAAAVAQALGEGGWLARTAGRGLRLPVVRWGAEGVYRLVAANRYRFPGSTDACRLPR